MALAQLLLDAILLTEAVALGVARITKDEAGLIQDRDLIALAEFAALVAADDGVVDESAVGGEVFEDSDGLTGLVLLEEDAVTVANGGDREDDVWIARPLAESDIVLWFAPKGILGGMRWLTG